MARGITENEVWQACDALLLEGARPTIERVRQKLGRGSPNTVSPMLETWFKHLGGRITDPGAFSALAAMPDPVHQAAKHLWEAAQAEARRDLDDRLREGLLAASANVEAEKERATIAEAAAYSANATLTHLQAEFDQLRETVECERAAHAATAARLDSAQLRCTELQSELADARQGSDEAQVRAALAIASADERAAGAERRAALEIERERALRTKAEKATEAVAKRFEAALKAEFAATGQLTAAEGRLAQLQLDTARREKEMQAGIARLEARVQELEAALSAAQQALARAAAPEALADQILAKLGAASQQGMQLRGATGRARTKKITT